MKKKENLQIIIVSFLLHFKFNSLWHRDFCVFELLFHLVLSLLLATEIIDVFYWRNSKQIKFSFKKMKEFQFFTNYFFFSIYEIIFSPRKLKIKIRNLRNECDISCWTGITSCSVKYFIYLDIIIIIIIIILLCVYTMYFLCMIKCQTFRYLVKLSSGQY